MSEFINTCKWVAGVSPTSTKMLLCLSQWKASCLACDRHWFTLCLSRHYILMCLEGSLHCFLPFYNQCCLWWKGLLKCWGEETLDSSADFTYSAVHTRLIHTHIHPHTHSLTLELLNFSDKAAESGGVWGGFFGLIVCQSIVEEGKDYSQSTHTIALFPSNSPPLKTPPLKSHM